MKHFLFTDEESGEAFLVGANNVFEALDIAELYFEEPRYIGKLSDFEAEISGLDEY